MSNGRDDITPNTLVSWLVGTFGVVTLGAIAWVGNNAAEIPVIKDKQAQQIVDMNTIRTQIQDVPVIKVQLDNLTKQIERITSAQENSSRAIDENRTKIMDHERRLLTLESGKRR